MCQCVDVLMSQYVDELMSQSASAGAFLVARAYNT